MADEAAPTSSIVPVKAEFLMALMEKAAGTAGTAKADVKAAVVDVKAIPWGHVLTYLATLFSGFALHVFHLLGF